MVYGYISCGKAEENSDDSYLTMLSNPGLMFGIINIVGSYTIITEICKIWFALAMPDYPPYPALHFLQKKSKNMMTIEMSHFEPDPT